MNQQLNTEIEQLWLSKTGPWLEQRGYALGPLFKAAVNRIISRCNDRSWTMEEMRKQHGDNFMAVLPEALLPKGRPATIWDYYEIGSARILMATRNRHYRQLQLFRQVHDDFQVFLSFESYVTFRYPHYDLAHHPRFGSAFVRYFHRALMALVDWDSEEFVTKTVSAPIKWRFVAHRDKSPVRK